MVFQDAAWIRTCPGTSGAYDEVIVEQERERLAGEWPGLKVTRADAIRSLFARATATEPGESYAEERRLELA